MLYIGFYKNNIEQQNIKADNLINEHCIGVESITIKAIAENSKAKLDFKEVLALKEGSNVTEIKVTAENGTTKSYKLTIIRSPKDQVLDSNNYLSSLTDFLIFLEIVYLNLILSVIILFIKLLLLLSL